MSSDTPHVTDLSGGRERRQFRMKACLGRGGFGEVYRATMLSSGGVQTEVAVKVLHAEVDPDSQAVQRLRDEGRLLGAVRHPSALKVYDLCLLDGRVALVTEFVEGQDLDKCLAGADPMPLRSLVEVVARVSDALHVAYTAPSPRGDQPLQLVHRDIKPANIRVGRHGEVKLLDFGIARSANVEREAHTETHAMLGSYLYMAPERFLDNADHGPGVDVFALGCTLYEGIAHKRLFGEMVLKELYLLVLDEAKFAAFVNEHLDNLPMDTPSSVIQLLSGMLELDPGRRPSHQDVSRTCYAIIDSLSGKTLDRWARERTWPTPRTVRGMLDGALITETGFSTQPAPARHRLPTPPPLDERLDEPHAETFEGPMDLARSVSATFERPSVVVGVGLAGGMVMAAVIASIAALGLGLLVWTSRPVNVEVGDATPVPLPLPIPAPEPVVVAPAPVAPAPAPAEVSPAPARPVPERVIRVTPTPVPSPSPSPAPPRPAPQPVPADVAPATVTVEGGVLVEFRGDAGTFRAGRLPPGSYDAWAYWEPGSPARATRFHATPGEQLTLSCSRFKRECTVK